MTTMAKRYDHPAYQVPVIVTGPITTGAVGLSSKFAAFTAMKLRAITMGPSVATTAAGSTPLVFKLSGTTTTTTTLGTALTSATRAAQNMALATALSLAQGDLFWVSHGTDATCVYSFAAELVVDAGADLTA